jgi:hypothetical protein
MMTLRRSQGGADVLDELGPGRREWRGIRSECVRSPESGGFGAHHGVHKCDHVCGPFDSNRFRHGCDRKQGQVSRAAPTRSRCDDEMPASCPVTAHPACAGCSRAPHCPTSRVQSLQEPRIRTPRQVLPTRGTPHSATVPGPPGARRLPRPDPARPSESLVAVPVAFTPVQDRSAAPPPPSAPQVRTPRTAPWLGGVSQYVPDMVVLVVPALRRGAECCWRETCSWFG